MNLASPYWYPFERGETRGITGAEGGTVVEDEQHDDGARIMLESGCLRAPFAITVTVYGWMVHTRFFADEATAKQAYDDMKTALIDVLRRLPKEDDDPVLTEEIDEAVETFQARFP
ncbi:MAG: hypothetical protein L6Q98_05295 [Anaerolineae bacterium]|nr:hypothetical protein [Anaerolineae bacterium]NUQ03649.1 hypothetical protein [Anaerolineae bacterium]